MCIIMHVGVCVRFSLSVWPFKRFLQGRGGREDNGSRHYLLLSCRLNIRPHTVWPSPTRTASRCTCAHAPMRRVHARRHPCRDDTRARDKVTKAMRACIHKVSHRGEVSIWSTKDIVLLYFLCCRHFKKGVGIYLYLLGMHMHLRARQRSRTSMLSLLCSTLRQYDASCMCSLSTRLYLFHMRVCTSWGRRQGSRFHSQSGSISSGRPQSWPPRGKLPTVGTSRDDCPCWGGLHMRTPNADPRCQTCAQLCICTCTHTYTHESVQMRG